MMNARVSMLALAFALFACANAFAQVSKPQPAVAANTIKPASLTEDPNAKAPMCELAIPKALGNLQESADKSCQTVSTCVRCTEKASGAEVYATLYAQPKIPRCNVINGVSYDKINKPEKALPIYVEVLQSVCTKDGVTLEATSPNTPLDPDVYDVSWEVDGKKVGKGGQVNCVCGKIGSVTVTERTTGRMMTKSMSISSACASNGTSKN